MKGVGVFFLLLISWSSWAAEAVQPAAATNYDTLQNELRAYIGQDRFAAALWGMKVVSLDTGMTIFEHNAQKLLKPASNAKLYTGALALHRLGSDYRIKTSLLSAAGPIRNGTLRGDLRIYGRGDPSFSARFHEGDCSQSFTGLVAIIRAAGIKKIRGNLVCDESFFQGPPFGSGWAWEDLEYYYGARVSSLTAEDNVVDLVVHPAKAKGEPCRIEARPTPFTLVFSNRTSTVNSNGSRAINIYRPIDQGVVYVTGQLPVSGLTETDAVTVPDPALFFGSLLKEALGRERIVVTGGIRVIDSLHEPPREAAGGEELAFAESPPMSELVARMMKPSQNLYAQLLLLQVGAHFGRARSGGTTERAGLAELEKFLGEIGIPERTVLLEEGSGLSRGALVTPAATVALLQFMDRHQAAAAFRDSLPIAGVDGTLRRRFLGTAAAGKLRAKTGTLRYVNTLSGYATTARDERLAFSIMLNNYAPPSLRQSSRDDIDAIAMLLVNSK